MGFARILGHPVGVIANHPMFLAGTFDINASDKAARFIRFCDCFNIPLLTLVDTAAYLPGKAQEFGGIIRHGAKILFAYSEATVPKVTVILRKGYGGAYVALCHRELGADAVFAWPTAEIAMMGAEGAASIVFRREIEKAQDPEQKRKEKIQEYRDHFANPYISGGGDLSIISSARRKPVPGSAGPSRCFGPNRKSARRKSTGRFPCKNKNAKSIGQRAERKDSCFNLFSLCPMLYA